MAKQVIPITPEEHVTIEASYARMMASIKVPINEGDQLTIRKAFELANESHSSQRRKSGEPYVLHPIEVARICAVEIGLGSTAIVCALLHDVVEDTDITLKEILKQFGLKVANIVDGLTKLDGTYTKDSPQAENFKKVLSTLVEDVRVVLIKMADRLHNLRTIGSMPRHKQLKIAAETMYIYAPLAHRLGLYGIKTEFQDICMKINEPDIYAEIADKLHASKKERTRYITEFIDPIHGKLEELEVDFEVIGRPKSIYSIYNKIREKNVAFEEIYDLFAIRVIADVPIEKEKSICWQIYSIVTDVYKPIPERLKDWVTTPKSNGYESLHTTVIGQDGTFVEVQIRTKRMDEIAEKGFAAHWKYKGVSTNPNVYEHWLDNIRGILETSDTDAIEFLSDFKTNLFSEEVYIYTPNGEMKVLPKGATALDFAFSIHSDIGSKCTAVKVNKKLVPLGYKLKNGDQLHVLTSKNQKPNESWLKIVITGKARSRIRAAIREEKLAHGEYGKESLMRKLKGLKIDFESNVDELAKHFGYNSRPELFFAIATDVIDLASLKNIEIEEHKFVYRKPVSKQDVAEEDKPLTKKQIRKANAKKENTSKILINDEEGDQFNYAIANCCKPVHGDKIFGYVTSGSGIKIHRINCPNATHLMAHYGYRVVKAEWAKSGGSAFVVDLLIKGIDDGPGVIERLTTTLSTKLGINIRSFSIAGLEGYFEGKISLLVINTNQLNFIIKTLKELDGIDDVIRTN